MSSAVTPAWAIDFWAESTMIRTARRKTSLPSILSVAADLGVEEALGAAVGVEVPAEQLAAAVDGLEDDGAGAVGEQDGGVAVLPVGDPGQRVGADDEQPLGAHGDQPVGDDQGVGEARAGGVDVERAAAQAELVRRPSPTSPARCGRASSWPGRRRRSTPGRARTCRAPGGRPRPTARPSCRRRGARGCRCARRSTRRWCPGPCRRGRGW